MVREQQLYLAYLLGEIVSWSYGLIVSACTDINKHQLSLIIDPPDCIVL